jgi:putative glutamine amidotransferase
MIRGGSPVIGVTADLEDSPEREPRCFLLQRYLHPLTESGATALILPPMARTAAVRRTLSLLDGLVITGGNFDIHPSYFGEKPIAELGVMKSRRTEFELEIAAAALRKDLPLLGLCGGEQALNVALGGSLYQDIAAQVPAALEHEQSEKKSYGGHYVEIVPHTRLSMILRRDRIEVNTSHHQAVKQLGKGLIIDAVADDGVIEGIESTRHRFVLGVQWHPEALAPKRQAHRRIFSAFIAACK